VLSMAKEINKQLKELQQIAITITRDNSISVVYKPKERTAYYEQSKNKITLTSNCLPRGIEKYPSAHAKLLDGLTAHECGHALLTNPLEDRYNRFENSKPFRNLAHFIVNVIEDKRINYFIELRYRHDLGKRLEFLRRLVKDMCEKALEQKLKTAKLELLDKQKNKTARQLISLLVNKGLYECDLPNLEKLLDAKAKSELAKMLEVLENTKYQRVAHDLVSSAEILYSTIARYITSSSEDNALGEGIPILSEGNLEGSLSEDIKEDLEDLEQKEREKAKEQQKQNLDKQLSKGLGYGIDKGDLIPSPECDIDAYNLLVNRNSAEISELLNKLKRTVKPLVNRAIFQRKGRLMNSIISKAYCNSLRREVTNIYQSSNVYFEKQKVALEILIDLSGSMDRQTALDICTVLTEVFSAWLEDKAFSVLVFGADYQKIKTFYEQSVSTKARIGAISVSASATNITKPLEDSLKMFNGVDTERTKILVIASDFCFSDRDTAKEILEDIEKSGIKLLFIGLCSVDSSNYLGILPNSKNVFRTIVDNPRDLPSLFLSIYTKATQTLIR